MIVRWFILLALLVQLEGCASTSNVATYHAQFARLNTREEKAAFAFDMMTRRIVTADTDIDVVYTIFGRDVSHEEVKDGISIVEIYLTDYFDSKVPVQNREPWVLRLEITVGRHKVRTCALVAPGEGK